MADMGMSAFRRKLWIIKVVGGTLKRRGGGPGGEQRTRRFSLAILKEAGTAALLPSP